MSKSSFSVHLLTPAEEDLTEIIEYIAYENRSAADRLLSKIEKNLELLSVNPKLGRVPHEEELKKSGYGFLVVDNYLLFYITEKKTIYVHRILHGARDYLSIL